LPGKNFFGMCLQFSAVFQNVRLFISKTFRGTVVLGTLVWALTAPLNKPQRKSSA
jgi:hypothetical protein